MKFLLITKKEKNDLYRNNVLLKQDYMVKNLLQGYHHWNYRTMVQEYFISIIFLAKFMAITLTLFLFHSLCCPGNNNTSSEDSNTFAKNVDVFLFWTPSLSDVFVGRKIQMWVVAVGKKIYLITLLWYLFIRHIGTMNGMIISC